MVEQLDIKGEDIDGEQERQKDFSMAYKFLKQNN